MVKCDYCHREATMNVQENNNTYSVDSKENYTLINSENHGSNDHYCDIHYRTEVLD